MKKSRRFKKILLSAILILTGIGLSLLSSKVPALTERVYSMGFFRLIGPPFSRLTGFLPFSIGEAIIALLILYLLVEIVSIIISLIKDFNGKKDSCLNFLTNVLMGAGIIYFIFILVWGLNYHRLPFAKVANMNTGPASVDELSALCRDLITRSNSLRTKVDENSRGVMYIKGGYQEVLKSAHIGYDNLKSKYPELDSSFGSPKPVLFSNLMSYTGITGVYFPFTCEANVNVSVPDSTLPSTVCHEMAHQRGYAREDEANYISYLSCTANPDPDFQYSGVMLALINSMNALYDHDEPEYMELSKLYSSGVKRDLNYIDEYWNSYEGPVERISNNINDAYLKANLQTEGVYSYGRMVDLLIAERRASGNK